jgi:hypothetical protein
VEDILGIILGLDFSQSAKVLAVNIGHRSITSWGRTLAIIMEKMW